MVNAKKTSFTATSVGENSLALCVALMRIQELEKEVSRLRHQVSVLSKKLNGRKEEKRVEEREEVAEVVAEVAAVGAPPITSGVYKVVAEGEDVVDEIMAGVESMSVGSEDDEDEVIDGKIVVRLPGDRKRRIAEAGEGERVEVEEGDVVRAIPVGPRSGVLRSVEGRRVPSGAASMWSGRGSAGVGKGFMFGMEGYGYMGGGRG